MGAFEKWWLEQMEIRAVSNAPLCEDAFRAGMRRAAEIAGANEDQFIALAGEAAKDTMRDHYSALASGAGVAAAAILKEIGE